MGKITIEIVDKDNHSVAVVVKPSFKELVEIASKGEASITGSMCYAMACLGAIKDLQARMQHELNQSGEQDTKKKADAVAAFNKKLFFGH